MPFIPIPKFLSDSSTAALGVLTSTCPVVPGDSTGSVPKFDDLANLCFYANGLLAPETIGRTTRRPAACTGGLHHLELYIVCGGISDFPPGVYHFGVSENAFQLLRKGDFRDVLVQATAGESAVAGAPAVIICTSCPWRNAWKYGERAYRHVFWDGGTLLANLVSVAAARSLPARVVLSFIDEQVNTLLGLDLGRELVIALIPVGYSDDPAPRSPTLEPIDTMAAPASVAEAVVPGIQRLHRASALVSDEEVSAWRVASGHPTRESRQTVVPLVSVPHLLPPSESIESVIRRRKSARSFGRETLSQEALSILLSVASVPLPIDVELGGGFVSTYLSVHGVDDVVPGAYAAHNERELELLRHELLRTEAAETALGQRLASDSAVNFYILADLDEALDNFGNRGYWAIQLTSGTIAGRLYLAAYAMGLAATGLTFFDDRVIELLRPRAAGRSAMFQLAVGSQV